MTLEGQEVSDAVNLKLPNKLDYKSHVFSQTARVPKMIRHTKHNFPFGENL